MSEFLKYVPGVIVGWAVLLAMLIFATFSGLAIYAWFYEKTLVLAGYEFGRPSIGAGAVVAYDTDGCPAGWVPFEEATARFVIGAGNKFDETFRTGADGSDLSTYSYRQKGGAETHTLTHHEMPEHAHSMLWGRAGEPAQSNERHGVGNDVKSGLRVRDIQSTLSTGRSEPHNNMPPYIALYFCKKDG